MWLWMLAACDRPEATTPVPAVPAPVHEAPAPIPEVPAPSRTSLCEADEAVVFTCTVSKGRLLSLCGPTDLSAMQYRFGRPGAIELRHPDVPEGSLQAFTFARYTRPLTTMMGLRFTRGGYTYEVFDDLVESQASAGVTVTMPDGGQSQLVCEGAVTSRLMELEDRVPTTDLWR